MSNEPSTPGRPRDPVAASPVMAMSTDPVGQTGISVSELAAVWWSRRKSVLMLPLALGLATYGLATLLPPQYTAKASFLPQQQQQSGIASALASLGPLVGINSQSSRGPADQYIALMQSVTFLDKLVESFGLRELYKAKFLVDARNELLSNVRLTLGKKDGIIYIEVDDEDPSRAADIANAHVTELKSTVARFALTEAQQRRVFFESQLKNVRDNLTKAQIALQESGFTGGAFKAEPRAAAEEYARLKAEVMSAEVRVQTMKGYLSENAPDFRQALATLQAFRQQLARIEGPGSQPGGSSSGYITKFREFKYQETLFDLFARQYELAKVDESRDGSLIQIIDEAKPPEKQSGPRKARMAGLVTLGSMVVFGLFGLFGHLRRRRADYAGSTES